MSTDIPRSTITKEDNLFDHLKELRMRLAKSCILVLVVFFALLIVANELYIVFTQPITDLLPSSHTNTGLIATDVTATFMAPFKLAIVCAFILTAPYTLNQMWQFIAPALYRHERRLALSLMLLSSTLFYAGICFAYFVIFPIMMAFFVATTPESVSLMPDISQLLNTQLKLIFVFALAFQTPIATFILIKSKIISTESLSDKRPYVILICFVLGMLLTPPDPISQVIFAVPMWVLFEVGLLMARLFANKKTTDTHIP